MLVSLLGWLLCSLFLPDVDRNCVFKRADVIMPARTLIIIVVIPVIGFVYIACIPESLLSIMNALAMILISLADMIEASGKHPQPSGRLGRCLYTSGSGWKHLEASAGGFSRGCRKGREASGGSRKDSGRLQKASRTLGSLENYWERLWETRSDMTQRSWHIPPT